MTQTHTKSPATLIATLGTEPQVVTASLDLLLIQEEPIDQVVVIHTTTPGTPIASAVGVLEQEFRTLSYFKRVALTLIPIKNQKGQPLSDVSTPKELQAAFRCLYKTVLEEKKGSRRVHLSIAGGRKSLAVYGMSTAQMLFDEHDRLWHLYSGGDFLDSKRLHPEPDDQVHLIPIPVILWSQVSPVLTDISQVMDPFEAADRIRHLQLNQRLEQCRAFVLGSLTEAERRVVALLVQEGLSDREIADRLSNSPRTVEQHLRSAYKKAEAHWELESVDRTSLIALLNIYYSLINTGYPA